MLNDIVVTLPKPHYAQDRVIAEASRYNLVNCGRRWGKTTLGEDRAVDPLVIPHPVAWYSPTYKDLLEVWRDMVEILQPVTARKNVQERRIENIAGGVLEFWSLDNQDAGRGRMYRRVIIDEAAMVPNLLDIWNYTIRPTLADLAGDAWIFSTPKGHNGFWHMYQWGNDPQMPDWTAWTMPTSSNPYISDDEIEAMRLTLPERVFRQEILAEFIDDAGGVFRRVADAAIAEQQAQAAESHQYVMGVDWGRHEDFTALVVYDVTLQAAVCVDRFTQIDYTIQISRLRAMADRFGVTAIVAEQNSMGGPLVEQLQGDGLPVQGFTTTQATKEQIIRDLEGAFERGEIKIINDPVMVGELQAYEQERLPAGKFRFNAPSGMHDDTVIALALAYHAGRNSWWAW